MEVAVEVDGRQQGHPNITDEFPELGPVALQDSNFGVFHGRDVTQAEDAGARGFPRHRPPVASPTCRQSVSDMSEYASGLGEYRMRNARAKLRLAHGIAEPRTAAPLTLNDRAYELLRL